MKHKIIISIFSIIIFTFFSSCTKYDFQEPDIAGCNLGFEPNISLEDFLSLYNGEEYETFLIDTNLVIKGTVIANDKSGNYYKSFVIQDSTETGEQTGLLISINEYESHNKYRVGDMIYIKCKNLYIGYYGGVKQLGSLFEGEIGRIEEPLVDMHIFNACNGKPIIPKLTYVTQLNAIPVNTLIKIEDVQFKLGELDETYADAGENVTTEQMITDCSNKTAVVRTSGYANFAADVIPLGKGSIIAVNGKYNGTPQLAIRDINEVQMNDARCGAIYEKDFEEITFSHPGGSLIENFTTGNWFTYVVVGETDWEPGYRDGNNFAEASNYENGSNSASEVWMISPAFNLTKVSNPILNFQNVLNFKNVDSDTEVYISNDYDGSSNPNSNGSWTKLTSTEFPPVGNNWNWYDSGAIDISSYVGNSSVYIAFVYKGTDSAGGTWRVDDIQIKDD